MKQGGSVQIQAAGGNQQGAVIQQETGGQQSTGSQTGGQQNGIADLLAALESLQPGGVKPANGGTQKQSGSGSQQGQANQASKGGGEQAKSVTVTKESAATGAANNGSCPAVKTVTVEKTVSVAGVEGPGTGYGFQYDNMLGWVLKDIGHLRRSRLHRLLPMSPQSSRSLLRRNHKQLRLHRVG